jgi:3-hydroxyacyl-[acyl-carrier-protein] dehydratase
MVIAEAFMDYSNILNRIERPYIAVDKLVSLEPGKRARGLKTVSGSDIFFTGVPFDKKVLPEVILLEALVQTGLSAIISHDGYYNKEVRFSAVENAKFTGKAVPGDTILLDAEIYKLRLSTGVCKALAYIDENCICEAIIIYGIE